MKDVTHAFRVRAEKLRNPAKGKGKKGKPAAVKDAPESATIYVATEYPAWQRVCLTYLRES